MVDEDAGGVGAFRSMRGDEERLVGLLAQLTSTPRRTARWLIDRKTGDCRLQSSSGVLLLLLLSDRYGACGGVEQMISSLNVELPGEVPNKSPIDRRCNRRHGVLGAFVVSR